MKVWSYLLTLLVVWASVEVLYYTRSIDLNTAVVAQQASTVTLALHKFINWLFSK